VPVTGAEPTAWPRRAAGLERVVESGILGGVVAGIPMGLFAMVASGSWLGQGVFTPAYRLAFMVETTVLDTAMREAAAGDPFYLVNEAFGFGVGIHCFVAGSLGAVFACVAWALRLRRPPALAVAGVLYGLAAAAAAGLVGLPAVARAMALGPPVASLAAQVGWPAFVAAHVLYGLTLGLWRPLRRAVNGPGEGATGP
jgi:hypothetical protein